MEAPRIGKTTHGLTLGTATGTGGMTTPGKDGMTTPGKHGMTTPGKDGMTIPAIRSRGATTGARATTGAQGGLQETTPGKHGMTTWLPSLPSMLPRRTTP